MLPITHPFPVVSTHHLTMPDDLTHDLLAAVEQQLASPRTPYVARSFERLVQLGITEAEARTQIALCLGEAMERLLETRKPFDEQAYQAALDELPMGKDQSGETPVPPSDPPVN